MKMVLGKFGETTLGLGIMLVFLAIPALILIASLVFAKKFLPSLEIVGLVVLGICLNILIPMSFFHFTRKAAASGMYAASYVFGATTWLASLLITYTYLGVFVLCIGLFFFGLGPVLLSMIGAAFHKDWSTVGLVISGICLTFGFRFLAIYLLNKTDDNRRNEKHFLIWIGRAYIGIALLIIFIGYISTFINEGWQYFDPTDGQFNIYASCVSTIAILAPGIAFLKFGEKLARKRNSLTQVRIA